MLPAESISFADLANKQAESAIFQPIVLPCGLVVQNRLVKVAMYEHLASFLGGPPNEHHLLLYSEWAKHDWGIVITGNVQIADDHLTLGRDIVLPRSHRSEEHLQPFRNLADSIHGLPSSDKNKTLRPNQTCAIMQLNHPGRQSSNFIGGRAPFRAPLAPSSIPIGSGGNHSLSSVIFQSVMFQTPKEMSNLDVDAIVEGFVRGAILAHKTGFDGVQLHAAHGYLLSQFLSSKSNARTDGYSVDNALKLLHHIVKRIRQSTGDKFAICIKLNAADYIRTEPTSALLSDAEKLALQHLITIAEWELVDIIEISGGDYEKPDFMSSGDLSKSSRQAFFAHFSHQVLKVLHSRESNKGPIPLILLTGGLQTPGLLRSALASKHADLLGIGRGSVSCPDLPSVLRKRLQDSQWDDIPFQPVPDLGLPCLLGYPPFNWIWNAIPKVKLIGAGTTMAWYIVTMRQIAMTGVSGQKFSPNFDRGGLQSIVRMWAWRSAKFKSNLYLIIISCVLVLLLAINSYK